MFKAATITGLLALLAGQAHAAGCAPEGGIEIAKIEAMNQMVLDMDFDGFARAIKDEVGIDIADGVKSVADIFTEGFVSCATIAQRKDLGGMVQNVVMFEAKVGPLFGYWLATPSGGDYKVVSFSLNTDLDEVMANLR